MGDLPIAAARGEDRSSGRHIEPRTPECECEYKYLSTKDRSIRYLDDRASIRFPERDAFGHLLYMWLCLKIEFFVPLIEPKNMIFTA